MNLQVRLRAAAELELFQAAFLLSGFSLHGERVFCCPVKNEYWGERGAPWYEAFTKYGVIKVGWRKHVMQIDWSALGVEVEIPDEVTKSKTMCHAWNYWKLVEYLALVRQAAQRQLRVPPKER